VKCLGDAPRLLGGIDMRYHDPHRAVVQQPRAFIQRAGANPHQRRHAGRQRGDANLCRLLQRKRTVFHVDEQEIMA